MSYYIPAPDAEQRLFHDQLDADGFPVFHSHDGGTPRQVTGANPFTKDWGVWWVSGLGNNPSDWVWGYDDPSPPKNPSGPAAPKGPVYGDVQIGSYSGTYGRHMWDGSQWVLIGALDPVTGSAPKGEPTRDANGDGYDDSTGLPVGVVSIGGKFYYQGRRVHPDGSLLSPAELAAEENAAGDARNTWSGVPSSGPYKGTYGTYIITTNPDGSQAWIRLGDPNDPSDKSSGGGTSAAPRTNTAAAGGTGGGGTNTTVHQGGFTNTNISEYGPERIAAEAAARADTAAEREKDRQLQMLGQKLNYELAKANSRQEWLQIQRAAAKDYAELTGSTDVGAFARFLSQAGNIQAGLAQNEMGALSIGALAPAAQALQTSEQPFDFPTWESILGGMNAGGGIGAPPAVGGGGGATGTAGGGTATPSPAAPPPAPPPVTPQEQAPTWATWTPPKEPIFGAGPNSFPSTDFIHDSAQGRQTYGLSPETVDALAGLDPKARAALLASNPDPRVAATVSGMAPFVTDRETAVRTFNANAVARANALGLQPDFRTTDPRLGAIPRAAQGTPGFVRNRIMIGGDAELNKKPDADGARPEVFLNPTGAPVGWVNYEDAKQQGFLRNAPRFAEGSFFDFSALAALNDAATRNFQPIGAPQPAPAPAPVAPAPTLSTPPTVGAPSASGSTTTSRPITAAPTTTAAAVASAPPIVPVVTPKPPAPAPTPAPAAAPVVRPVTAAPTLSTPPVVAPPAAVTVPTALSMSAPVDNLAPALPALTGLQQTPGLENLGIPADYLQRVLAERLKAQERLRLLPPSVSYLDIGYGGLDPTLRSVYETDMQTGYNIPIASTRAAYERYRPTGFTRRNFQVYG